MPRMIPGSCAILLLFFSSTTFAAETGMLYVKSEPPGATVILNGEERGKTPVLLKNVEPGYHVVEVRPQGAGGIEEMVTVEAGKVANLNVRIPQGPASLTVISDPLEATVHLDERERGKTPITIEQVEAGDHEVVLELDDYERAVRKVELRPGENRVLEIRLRRKGEGIPAVEAMDEDEKKLAGVLHEFETMLGRGDYAGARKFAKGKARRRAWADVAKPLRAAARAAKALEARQEAIRRGAEALVGTKVTLGTRSGPRKGEVEEVTDEGVSLGTNVIINRRVVGETRFTVAWDQLSPRQEEQLAEGWDGDTADAKVALALLALARRDLLAAGKAVHGAADHPLADYVRGTIDAVKRAPSEAAARRAWEEIERLARAPDLSAAGARKLLVKLDSFEKKHGQTDHAASMKARIAEARKTARDAVTTWPPDAVQFGRNWYKLFEQRMTWHEAKIFCEKRGGHLVSITSKKESKFVADLAREAGSTAWIGFTDERQEGNWEWVTGEKVTFTAWARGQPDNYAGGQHYARLWRDFQFRWDDDGQWGPTPVVCEWEPPESGRRRSGSTRRRR